MPDNEKEMTTGFDSETEDTEDIGSPVGLFIVGGSLILGGLYYVGRKIFGRKNYTEVIKHDRFGRTDK